MMKNWETARRRCRLIFFFLILRFQLKIMLCKIFYATNNIKKKNFNFYLVKLII